MIPNLPLTDYASDIRPDILDKIKDKHTLSINDILHMPEQDLIKKYFLLSKDVQSLRRTCAEIVYPLEQKMTRAGYIYHNIDDTDDDQNIAYLRNTHVTTGDEKLDVVLGGKGLPVGCLVEVFGAAATGKTTLALQLCTTVQLTQDQGGLGKGAIWIATEQQFPSTRLFHIVSALQQKYESLNGFDPGDFVAILPLKDLDTQEHVLLYRLSQLVDRFQAGLIVLDSITSNFRADESAGKDALARAKSLYDLGASLKKLAKEKGILVLCINQVSTVIDNKSLFSPFSTGKNGRTVENGESVVAGWHTAPDGKSEYILPYDAATPEPNSSNIIPALGFTWSNIVTMRIQLSRGTDNVIIIDDSNNTPTEALSRKLKVHFAPHVGPNEILVHIGQGGLTTSAT